MGSGGRLTMLLAFLPAFASSLQALEVASALTRGNPNGLTVTFSEPVAAATATHPDSYTIAPGVTVNSVTLIAANVVRLHTSPIVEGQAYTLTVNGVTDTAEPPNPIAADTQRTFLQTHGGITRREFHDIGGSLLADLTDHTKFTGNQPDVTAFSTSLETPVDVRDNYGVQFQGYLTAPVTGDYIFYLSSDDQGALFLSTDENPANQVQIATEPVWNGSREFIAGANQASRGDPPMNLSAPIHLEAGHRYYLEALMKEGSGGDNLAVTWRIPGGPEVTNGAEPILGEFLSGVEPLTAATIVTQPQNQTVNEHSAVTFTFTLTGTPPYDFQWYRNGEMLVGENAATLTLSTVTAAMSGTTIHVVCGNGLNSLRSEDATLTVVPDLTPPQLVFAEGRASLDEVGVGFSEPIDATDAVDLGRYQLSGGLTILGATLWGNQRLVILKTSPQTPGQGYTVTVNGLHDRATSRNVIAADSQLPFTGFEAGLPVSPLPPGYQRLTVTTRTGPVTVVIPRREFHFEPAGTTYYLATNGDDANPGTLDQPWRTFAHAVPHLRAGDCLYVREGDYQEPFVIRNSGVAGRPIIVSAYPGERARVRPPQSWDTTGRPEGTSTITLWGVRHVWIHGFEIEGYPVEYGPVPGPHHYHLSNCIMAPIGDAPTEGCQILNNLISKAQHCGIKGNFHGALIEGNVVFDNGISSLDHGMYLPAEDGSGLVVRGNATFRNTGWGLHFYSNPAKTHAYNNLVFENGAGIVESGHDNIIAHNVAARNAEIAGIWLVEFGAARNNAFLNNIVADNQNNQFDVQLTDLAQSRGNVIDYSLAFPDAEFTEPVGIPWLGSHLILADPRFEDAAANDYRLRVGSPAKRSAGTLPLVGAHAQPDLGLFPATEYWEPTLAEIPAQSVNEGAELRFAVQLSAPALPGVRIGYRLADYPPRGAGIDPVSGEFQWTPREHQGPGDYRITVVAQADDSPVVCSARTFTVTVNDLNQPPVLGLAASTTTRDFAGTVDLARNEAAWAPGNIEPLGAGAFRVTAFGGGQDNFSDLGHFAWREVYGDFDARVRVGSLTAAGSFTRAGLMVRESLEPDARMSFAFVFPAGLAGDGFPGKNGYALDRRHGTGTQTLPQMEISPEAPFPNAWLRLQRIGNVLSYFRSDDGQAWTQLLSQDTDLPPAVYLGLGTQAARYETDVFTVAEYHDFRIEHISPQIVSNRRVDAGFPIQLTLVAQDFDRPAQNLLLSTPGLPAGASFDPATGVFSWTPSPEQLGSHAVTFVATDDGSPPASSSMTVNVEVTEAVDPPLYLAELDAAAFRVWLGGEEQPVAGLNGPEAIVWTRNAAVPESGLAVFGRSEDPGPRHLRLGFNRLVPVGSVLVETGGRLSVLKPGVAYPGDLNNEEHWIPAVRLDGSAVSATPLGLERLRFGTQSPRIALWVLPPGTATRALRFTHEAGPADPIYEASVGGVFVFARRFANLAPFAHAADSVNPAAAPNLVNGRVTDGGFWWDNTPVGQPREQGGPQVVSSAHPETPQLHWPRDVTLHGVVSLWTGFAEAEVQAYRGPPGTHPDEAVEADWQTIASLSGYAPPNGPSENFLKWLPFSAPVSTRALRLRITQALPETPEHQPYGGQTRNGRRVWLGEWMALQDLGETPLEDAVVAPAGPAHAAIPVHFTLPEPRVVTLVIEDSTGRRVRNLVSETPFPAGENTVWWDGFDDQGVLSYDPQGRVTFFDPAGAVNPSGNNNRHQGTLVEPGTYRVRGLTRQPLDLRYEFTVYNSGNPPWPVPDGQYPAWETTGHWLSDHYPPRDLVFLPGTTEQVFIASPLAESGDGMVWVDLEGTKLAGRRGVQGYTCGWEYIEEDWTSASHLARDDGLNAMPDVAAYLAVAFGDGLRIHTISPDRCLKRVIKRPWEHSGDANILGIAARDGRLVVSVNPRHELWFINAATGQYEGAATVNDPRGLAFDAAGRLLALSGNRLLRFELTAGSTMLGEGTEITAALDEPRDIELDAAGNLYVSQHGLRHNVKVFTAAGAFVREIGVPGPVVPGPYDEQHMQHPEGMTLTPDGRLWVAEFDHAPKRVSVWRLDGTFVKAFYGPTRYGGGGHLDPVDRNRFYLFEGEGGMEFELDWDAGTSRLARTYYRLGEGDWKMPVQGWGRTAAGPETPIHFQGQHYLTDAYGGDAGALPALGLWKLENGLAQPVAACGLASIWPLLSEPPLRDAVPPHDETNPLFFVWSDLNYDHAVQPEELQFRHERAATVTINQRLEFVTGTGRICRPVSFTAAGVPVYDLATGSEQLLTHDQANPDVGGILASAEGWSLIAGGPIRGVREGQVQWNYPSPWPSLHSIRQIPLPPLPSAPGQLFGTTKFLGFPIQPSGSDAGPLVGINGDYGNAYLFTTDGLLVGTLFQDSRVAPFWQMPSRQRGLPLNGISLGEEAFHTSLNQTYNGEVYVVGGHNHSSLVRVDGLDSIRRFHAPDVLVTPALLAQAHADHLAHEAARIALHGRKTLTVLAPATPPATDGDLGDWTDAHWVEVDAQPTLPTRAAVAVGGGRLHAAFVMLQTDLLYNDADDPVPLFHSGGGLDLMLGTDPLANPDRNAPVAGDLRVLITRRNGLIRALLMRPVSNTPGTPGHFASSWRTNEFASVEDISHLVEFQQRLVTDPAPSRLTLEVAIPLSVLGLQPSPGMTILGDIGLLTGKGGRFHHRATWHSQTPEVILDLAGDTMLTPQLWGRWHFPDEVPADVRRVAPASLLAVPDLNLLEGAPLVLDFRAGLGVRREFFGWPAQVTLDSLTNRTLNPRFPNQFEAADIWPSNLDIPERDTLRYQPERLRAWLLAPLTGDYTFWISSDEPSALLLSPDDNPANALPIAWVPDWSGYRQWNRHASQQSAPVHLEAGRRYYFEALRMQSSGGEHFTVRWQLPDGGIEEPLPAVRLQPVQGFLSPARLTGPVQHFAFGLGSGAPDGAVMDPVTGLLTWTPPESAGGQSFPLTVRVADDGEPPLFAEQTFNVTVTEVNTVPAIAEIAPPATSEGQPFSLTPAITDADLPANVLNVLLTAAPSGMTINPVTHKVSWTPDETHGGQSFPVTVRVVDDGQPPLSAERSFTVSVAEVNAPPTVSPINDLAVNEASALTFIASFSEADIPVQAVTWSLAPGAPSGAAVHPTEGTFSWTPSETQGPGMFPVTILATDNGTPPLTGEHTFMVNVHEVNATPVLALIGAKSVDEGEALSFTVSAGDPNDTPANAVTLSATGLPSGATFNPATGAFAWTPGENHQGAHAVTFTATDDGTPPLSASEVVTLTVAEVNSAPQFNEVIPPQTINEGATLTLTNQVTDADLPANTLVFSRPADEPAGTAMDAVTGVFTWTPTEAQGQGAYTLRVIVTDDGVPPLTATNEFTVTVGEVNAPPVLSPIGGKSAEEGAVLNFNVSAGDPNDTPANAVTLSVAGLPTGATFDPATGAFDWTPDETQQGEHQVTFTATDDGVPPLATSETVTIAVAEVNSAPQFTGVIPPQTLDELASLTLTNTATDADLPPQTLTYALVSGAPEGATVDAANGIVRWTPSEPQGPGSFTIQVIVTDDGAPPLTATNEFTVTVREVNLAPVAGADAATTAEDTPLDLPAASLLANDSDPDGNQIGVSTVSSPSSQGGAVTLGEGVIRYTPAADFHGLDTFSYTLGDGSELTANAVVTVTVTPVNDMPAATPASLSTDEDVTLPLTLAGSDVEESALNFTVVQPPANGALEGTVPNLTYVPVADFHGTDSFTFTVNDGELDSPPATVSLTVHPVNDPPTVALTSPADGLTLLAPATVRLVAAANDPDGTVTRVEFFQGAVKLGETSLIPYQLDLPGLVAGEYHFSARATDDQTAGATSATVSLTVAVAFQDVTLLPDGTVRLELVGEPGATYEVEVSSDLSGWTGIGDTTASPDGTITFTESSPGTTTARFYRVVRR